MGDFARWQAHIGRGDGLLQLLHAHATFAQPGRIKPNVDGATGAADGLHLARATHPFQVLFYAAGHALQVQGRRWLTAPQRHAQNGHIVNPFGFDHRRHHAQALGQPILIGAENVVQAHHRFGARYADLELHRQHRHARARHRIGVFDAVDLRQHLLGGLGDHFFHIGTGRAREGNDDIRHRDVDLRLFFARRDQHGEQAQQQGHQRQQRRDGVVLKLAGDAARQAQRLGRIGRRGAMTHGVFLFLV